MSAPSDVPTRTWTSTPEQRVPDRARAARRRRSVTWFVVGLAALALTVLVLAVSRPPGSVIPYDPDNSRPDGSRALAQVLGDQGVEVEHVTTVADAIDAAGPGTTLLVAPAPLMVREQADALAASGADVVLAGAGRQLAAAFTGGRVEPDDWGTAPRVREPRCDLPAAVAAGTVRLGTGLVATGPDVTTCWTDGDGTSALAAVTADGRQVTLVHDPAFLRNDTVLDEGAGTLALHLLGAHDRLVWLVQDPTDLTAIDDPPASDGDLEPDTSAVVPRWLAAVLGWAAVVAVVAALWRGRRLGGLVGEDLPVVVPSAESTRGRARLYRRARARGHGGAALRASTADRIARRLGVPRTADPAVLVDAVARATGHDPVEVDALLYGPPPADDAGLVELAHRLDILESEVHRS
ncbi:uncharacterized protein DUF4350 [Isoptericola jiangsuensis]|uniref:Uncharacterized protein DUF4350 n=1 Tax=Isoptericola jiangsuensis TaxID=548579 RepID=A0A2A9F0N2_9MICO|nr:DUF4350 domain-containing protein [Isoptericola jiangsuensis]PFG44035.1 uncharacterized protein DUF4350 [Isoptericola jiangsuensis]